MNDQFIHNVNREQDKLSKNLNDSQELLKHLKRLIDESRKFNIKAREYVVNVKKELFH